MQVVSDRLRRYLDGRADQYGVEIVMAAGGRAEVVAERVAGLPRTARALVEPFLADLPVVRFRCVDHYGLGEDLTLSSFEVERPVVAV